MISVSSAFYVTHAGYIRGEIAFFLVSAYRHLRATRRGRRSFSISSSKSGKFNEASLRDRFFFFYMNFNDQNKPYCVLKRGVFRHSRGVA